MNPLEQNLWRACAKLRLRIELSFELKLSNGSTLSAVARLPDLGAPNGMLIFGSFLQLQKHTSELIDAGYGCSVLDSPENEEFDLDNYKSMFADWGWSGKLGAKPAWM